MEYSLVAPLDGTVTDLTVSAGSQVKEGALLARIEKVTEL
jgi:biotin carboxyl carrier protein